MVTPAQLDRLPYSAIRTRPRIEWPDGKTLAVWVVPNIEVYEFLPPPHRARNPWPRMAHPDVAAYGHREYGNRVGMGRLFDATDEFGITCTVSLNLETFRRYPTIMEGCKSRGWDHLCHGLTNTQYLYDMPIEEERDYVAACQTLNRELFGKPIKGWLSPGNTYSINTPDLVADSGIDYYCDWYHDDQPTYLEAGGRQLMCLPYSTELNDTVLYRKGYDGEDFLQFGLDHFETLYEESKRYGLVMCIAVHPFISGQPHRIDYLRRLFDAVRAREGCWMATGAQICDWFKARYPLPEEREGR
jgi:peptidoglycan/xylan/chitin deacetylase (PgdA/CDA1 family)